MRVPASLPCASCSQGQTYLRTSSLHHGGNTRLKSETSGRSTAHTLLQPAALHRRPSPCRRQNFRPPPRAALLQPSYWHSSTLVPLPCCPRPPSARPKNRYASRAHGRGKRVNTYAHQYRETKETCRLCTCDETTAIPVQFTAQHYRGLLALH